MPCNGEPRPGTGGTGGPVDAHWRLLASCLCAACWSWHCSITRNSGLSTRLSAVRNASGRHICREICPYRLSTCTPWSPAWCCCCRWLRALPSSLNTLRRAHEPSRGGFCSSAIWSRLHCHQRPHPRHQVQRPRRNLSHMHRFHPLRHQRRHPQSSRQQQPSSSSRCTASSNRQARRPPPAPSSR